MSNVKIKKVFGNRLSIKPDQAKERTDGGLFIPDNAKKTPPMGEVMQIGKLCKEVKPGMKVFYTGGATAPITVDKETFHVMRETDVVMELDASGNVERIFDDRVLVNPDETAAVTESGIIIPDAFKEETSSGVVLKIGASVKDTIEGTRIIFGKQAGHYVSVNSKELLVLREGDIVMEV